MPFQKGNKDNVLVDDGGDRADDQLATAPGFVVTIAELDMFP